jgi:hypothetical protein
MPSRFGISVALSCSLAVTAPLGCGSGGSKMADGEAGAMSEADAMDAASETGDGAEACGVAIADAMPLVCSVAGVTHAELVIHNTCGALTIEMFWVDYKCGEVSYGTIAPGQTFDNNSWVSHPWRLRNATTHALLREIPPLDAATDITYP